jgi:MoxR-like ATPase
MKPAELAVMLDSLIRHNLKLSAMIWGPPGIGKSSIVAQTASAHSMQMIDLRLSQLAPTDLRGLPVARDTVARWLPPEFLPQEGAGVLFLDEINLAPPTMQGMAQQLILDRRVGSYTVPEGWFIWAAGNRSEDRAAVFDMPAPLANLFLHVDVAPDLESFRLYALERGIHEQIVAFVSFRPELLHRLDPQQPAWPSPRTWEMASRLHEARIDVAPAVGAGTAAEFRAYLAVYADLPDLERILAGEHDAEFPSEPSLRYATTVGLIARARDEHAAYQALRWLARVAPVEWVQLFASELFQVVRLRQQWHAFEQLIGADDELQGWLAEHERILEGGGEA